MRCHAISGLFALLCLTACLLPAHAGDDLIPDPGPPRRSSLWLDGGYDSLDTRSGSAMFELAVAARDTLTLGAGSTLIPLDGDDLYAGNYLAGYRARGLSFLDAGLLYEFWGDPDFITVHKWQLALDARWRDWTLGIAPEFRQYNLYARPFLGGLEVEFDSSGWGVALDYRPGRHWRFRINGGTYDYSVDVRRLNSARAILVFQSQVLVVAVGLLDRYANAEIGYEFEYAALRLYRTHSVSAVDDARSEYTGAKLSVFLAETVTLELGGGWTDNELTEDMTSGTLSLGLHW